MVIHPLAVFAITAVICGALSLRVQAQTGDASTVNAYIEAAVALEQCDAGTFSMIDDIRFGLFLSRYSGYKVSLAEATTSLRAARTTLRIDCAKPDTQSGMKMFAADVLPRLRGQQTY
jgi:hypothetical protein